MYKAYNISLPSELAKRIEQERGDIPRSTFIAKLLERALGGKRK